MAAPANAEPPTPTTGWDSLTSDDQEMWDAFMLKQINMFVKFVPDQMTAATLVN